MSQNSSIIGVVGAGTMGNGIAHVFSVCSKIDEVVLVDLDQSILNQAKLTIEKNLKRQVKKNILSSKIASQSIGKIIFTNDISMISQSDLVIEAVKEDLNIKEMLFNQLDILTSKNTILATNTSSISINQIAKSTVKPENVIGMNFMNPVPIMKLVEIIKGKKTNNSIVKRTLDYVSLINKIPIECNDSPGFVSNRILMPMINEAAFTYMEGVATVEAIDGIMKLGMGHPMGPLMLADLIGIDVCVNILEVLQEDLEDIKYKPNNLLIQMIEKGHLGKKTGKGFYNHEL